MPQNAFFLRTHDLLVSQKMTQRHFISTLYPLSMVIFATATVLAFVLLRDSRFNFHCYTQREATSTQKSARKCTATSRDFFCERLHTKRFHSRKPASLNRPILVRWFLSVLDAGRRDGEFCLLAFAPSLCSLHSGTSAFRIFFFEVVSDKQVYQASSSWETIPLKHHMAQALTAHASHVTQKEICFTGHFSFSGYILFLVQFCFGC